MVEGIDAVLLSHTSDQNQVEVEQQECAGRECCHALVFNQIHRTKLPPMQGSGFEGEGSWPGQELQCNPEARKRGRRSEREVPT